MNQEFNGKTIVKWRVAKGLSQIIVAQKAKVNLKEIKKCEQATSMLTMNIHVVNSICRAFSTSPSEIENIATNHVPKRKFEVQLNNPNSLSNIPKKKVKISRKKKLEAKEKANTKKYKATHTAERMFSEGLPKTKKKIVGLKPGKPLLSAFETNRRKH